MPQPSPRPASPFRLRTAPRAYARRARAAGLIALAAVAAAALADRAAPPARAQAADPRVEVWLHHSLVGIQTASTARPTVRLRDAAGGVRTVVTPPGAPAGGRWQIDLSPNAPLDQKILVRPGDRIEVTLDGKTTTVVARDLPVDVDADRDVIAGRAPAGTAAVFVQLHRDEAWFDPPLTPGVLGPVLPAADGAFALDVADRFDLQGGTWGEAVAVGQDGHFTIMQFAPPAVLIHASEPYAILRSTPPDPPVLATQSDIGTELFRSAPAYALGGVLFAVLMVPGGVIENGIYQPGPGETVVMRVGDRTVLRAPLPELVASVDAGARSVWGHAAAGARTVVALNPTGAAAATPVTAVVRADDGGRFAADFAATTVGSDGTAAVLTHAGAGVGRTIGARVPRQHVLLYSAVITGTVPGWGALTVEQRAPDGTRKAWATTRADAAGTFTAELLTDRGALATLAPGDRLAFLPERGRAAEVEIPALTAEVDADKQTLRGAAPPGAALRARVYSADPDYFGITAYLQPSRFVAGLGDAAGRYALPCAPGACPMRYGSVIARVGSLDAELLWLDVPFLGLGVTASNAIGRATAGLPVTVVPIGRDGRPGAPQTDIVRPTLDGSGLPRLEVPLVDAYPDGLQVDDRVQLAVGDRHFEAAVPAFEWRADTPVDAVSGTGPPLRLLVGIGFARPQATNRNPVGAASALIGLDRRWRLAFTDFDLRAGDDLQLYVLFDGFFLWWDDTGVDGAPEPTAAPTRAPTARPSATPAPVEPTPTLARPGGRGAVYLPWARGA